MLVPARRRGPQSVARTAACWILGRKPGLLYTSLINPILFPSIDGWPATDLSSSKVAVRSQVAQAPVSFVYRRRARGISDGSLRRGGQLTRIYSGSSAMILKDCSGLPGGELLLCQSRLTCLSVADRLKSKSGRGLTSETYDEVWVH